MTPEQAVARLVTEAAKAGRGSSASYVAVVGTSNDAGVATETKTTTTVRLFGPLGDSKTSEAQGAVASFVLPAGAVTPKVGHRIVLESRTWLVQSVQRHAVGGTLIAWELGCAETVAA
ncbi:MAG: hypothetical protein WAT39_07010 [Planctomycetota bacterium]